MQTPFERLLARRIRKFMAEHGLTQVELAGYLGWSPSDLNDILSGRKRIGFKRQKHIASVLPIDISYVRSRSQNLPPRVRRLAKALKKAHGCKEHCFPIVETLIEAIVAHCDDNRKTGRKDSDGSDQSS